MPSPIIEQIRQQFFASMGINEYTPISDDQAAQLIDQWEQFLYQAASRQSGTGYQNPPPYRPGPVSYVPPNQRTPGGGVYVPPPPGNVRQPGGAQPGRPQVRIAPPVQSGGGGGGVYVAPPGR